MDELAFFEIPPDRMPKSLQSLQTALEDAGLRGKYKVKDDTLRLVCDGDRLRFDIVPAIEDPLPNPAGIEVTAEVQDEAATLIELSEIFHEAFPGCQGSTEYEDDL